MEFGAEPQPITISKADGGGLTYVFGTGSTYTVKFDGSEATVPNLPGMTVSGHKMDDDSVALTYHRNGQEFRWYA
jgi:hypothetical protein